MILLLFIFFLFFLIYHKKSIETFTSSTSQLHAINNRLDDLNSKFIDVKTQVMSNHKLQCIETDDDDDDTEATVAPVDVHEEIDTILNNLRQGELEQEEPEPITTHPPFQSEVRRLDYDPIDQLLSSETDELHDIQEIDFKTTPIPEQQKLANHLQCYNAVQVNRMQQHQQQQHNFYPEQK